MLFLIDTKQAEQKVKVYYFNEQHDKMYVKRVRKDGVIVSTTAYRQAKLFPFSKAVMIQMALENDFKITAYKLYDQ